MKRKIIMAALTAAMLVNGITVYAEETSETGLESLPAIEVESETEFLEETESILEEKGDTETESALETVSGSDLTEEMTDGETEEVLEEISETTENMEAYKQTGVEGFVYRLYKLVLNREPEQKGYTEWVNWLKNGQTTGVEAGKGFVMSVELQNRKLSNSAYVEMLYKTFLNRSADASGKKTWVTYLEKGMSREWVYSGFANSVEFQDICNSFGIQRGTYVLTAPKDQNAGITTFVYRCYQKFLGRTPDDGGLNTWCNQLLSGQMNAKEAARGFVMSNEFQNKKMSNEDYVKTMYLGLFDRSADDAGLSGWVDVLEAGNSRESVFYGFADSQEFRTLATGFGLNGDWAGSVVTYKISKEDFIQCLMDNRSMWQMDKYEATNYSGYFDPGYSLIDLDLDGQPELVVTMAGGTMHNAPTEIYRVQNGKVVLVNSADAGVGEMQDLKLYYKNTEGRYVYVDNRIHRSGTYATYYSIVEMYVSGNSLTEVTKFASSREGSSWKYYQEGQEVSKSQYDNAVAAYYAGMRDVNMQKGFVSYKNWTSYSISQKTSALSSMYDTFSYTK